MWKKVLIFILAITILFTFAACSNEEEQVPTEKSDEAEGTQIDQFAGLASADYAKLMRSEKFYLTYTMYTMGMDFEGSQAVADGKTASKVDMFGTEMFTIVDDGVMYDIDTESQTYTVTELKEEEKSNYETDYTDLVYVDSGNSTITSLVDAGVDSESYDYDEFVIDIELSAMDEEDLADLQEAGIDTTGKLTIRYYLNKDGSLYAIVSTIMDVESVMVIHQLTDQIPDDMLDIPAEYVEAEE